MQTLSVSLLDQEGTGNTKTWWSTITTKNAQNTGAIQLSTSIAATVFQHQSSDENNRKNNKNKNSNMCQTCSFQEDVFRRTS